MFQPQISVIIPVYNVEKYLRRCVDSIIHQTYTLLEIILVDDGSPDNCPQMCDDYSLKDHRIKVIHKKDGGLSSARNAGLKSSHGDYISFIDGDDWIAEDTYEYCINKLGQFNAGVIQFDYIRTRNFDANIIIKNEKEKISVFKGKSILQNYLEAGTKDGSYSVCKCVFNRRVINDLKFREEKINEDIDFKYRVLQQTECMIVSNQIKYFYYQSGDSLSVGPLKLKDFDLYEAAEELVKLTKDEEFGTIRELGELKKARTPLSLLCKIAYCGIGDPSINKEETIKKLKKELRTTLKVLLKGPLPFSRKVLAVMFGINYKMTEFCINLAKMAGAKV